MASLETADLLQNGHEVALNGQHGGPYLNGDTREELMTRENTW